MARPLVEWSERLNAIPGVRSSVETKRRDHGIIVWTQLWSAWIPERSRGLIKMDGFIHQQSTGALAVLLEMWDEERTGTEPAQDGVN